MSEVNESGEVERKIPVSDEDRENVINYSKNFGASMSDELKLAMDIFVENSNYGNMLDFKLELCKWLLLSEHDSFSDSLWDHPKEAAKDIMFDLQFDKDVQEELGDDDEKAK